MERQSLRRKRITLPTEPPSTRRMYARLSVSLTASLPITAAEYRMSGLSFMAAEVGQAQVNKRVTARGGVGAGA